MLSRLLGRSTKVLHLPPKNILFCNLEVNITLRKIHLHWLLCLPKRADRTNARPRSQSLHRWRQTHRNHWIASAWGTAWTPPASVHLPDSVYLCRKILMDDWLFMCVSSEVESLMNKRVIKVSSWMYKRQSWYFISLASTILFYFSRAIWYRRAFKEGRNSETYRKVLYWPNLLNLWALGWC